MSVIREQACKVRDAARELVGLSTDKKNEALKLIAEELAIKQDYILAENSREVDRNREDDLSDAVLDRLVLTPKRVQGIIEGIKAVIALPDPVGEELDSRRLHNDLLLRKVRVPLGAIGIIYEARPNVTVDAAVLCLKAGNAVLLRGSSSAVWSNAALVKVIKDALSKSAVSTDAVAMVEDTGRETIEEMLKLNEYLDVVIPRGGAGLIRYVVENASVPILETGAGNCHVYIHADADYDMAEAIIINAKTQRPSVCNAAETLLINKEWGAAKIKKVVKALQDKGVECRCCKFTASLIPGVRLATVQDWETEFLDYILAVKAVDSLDDAIAHINRYGTRHSEAIVTADKSVADRFMCYVDAAAVYHNASTRFTDGFEYGFGAEIGISTQKLHARGPMGLRELTSYKYLVSGTGQVRT